MLATTVTHDPVAHALTQVSYLHRRRPRYRRCPIHGFPFRLLAFKCTCVPIPGRKLRSLGRGMATVHYAHQVAPENFPLDKGRLLPGGGLGSGCHLAGPIPVHAICMCCTHTTLSHFSHTLTRYPLMSTSE